MPLDIPTAPADVLETEPQFVEPQLPDADSDDWQVVLRQIFATEGGIWQRRGAGASCRRA